MIKHTGEAVAHWKVKMEDKAEAELTKLLKDKIVTPADIKVLLRWVSEMEEFGPEYLAISSEWHDHELDREWKDYRSSAFSSTGESFIRLLMIRL